MADPAEDPNTPPADPADPPDPGTPPADPPSVAWPDNWRQGIAGNDEKALKQLERYASPPEIWKKARALEQRLSSGELRSALPKDATEEQVKAWRVENGIPESPEKYDLTFSDGLVIGEEDKPIIDDFLKRAHGGNYTPAQVKEAVSWYYDFQTRMTEQQAQADETAKQKTEDELRGTWGNDYRGNLQRVHNLLDSGPTGLRDQLLNGRLADGTPIGSSPLALQWIVQMSREMNPSGIVVPAGGDESKGLENEIAALEVKMRDRGSDYWKGPLADKNQTRLRQLYEARDKVKARAA